MPLWVHESSPLMSFPVRKFMTTQQDDFFFNRRYIGESLEILPANCLSFNALFNHYLEVGFLYEKKLKRLNPHRDLIRQNWDLAMTAGRELMWTLVYKEHRNDTIGTITSWRATNNGWVGQHLASPGKRQNLSGVVALLLSAHSEGERGHYYACQNWYSPTNKDAMKIYGGMVEAVGRDQASCNLLNYLEVNPEKLDRAGGSIDIVKCTQEDQSMIISLAERCRGDVYVKGEELDHSDLELSLLDGYYRKFGLGRRRYLWKATDISTGVTLGVIIANRAPFGLNFSFLENRCDLLVNPELDKSLCRKVCSLLIRGACDAYFNQNPDPEYPLKHLVVLCDDGCSETLGDMGAVLARQYHQGIWLSGGFPKWKAHMESVFELVIKRFDRQNPHHRSLASM